MNLIDPWGLEPLAECAQEVLAPYFPDVDLSEVELEEGLPYLVRKFSAIDPAFFTADGNTIHYSPGSLEQDSAKGLAVLGHELEHVRQYRAAGGKWAFRLDYFRDYRQLQKAGYSDSDAYELNNYEVDASEIEKLILQDLTGKFPRGGICECYR